ncbi:MAG: amidohydrolase family protein [Nanobdellota archaeon]
MEDFQKIEKRILRKNTSSSSGRYSLNNNNDKDNKNILIHNIPYFFTCDENDKIRIFTKHSIFIKEGIIKKLIPAEKADPDKYDLVYDAGKKGGVVITPALINTHAHPPMYLMRSIMTLEEGEGLEETIATMPKWERNMSSEDYAIGAIGDIVEQQRYGIATTLSHYGVFNPIEFASKATKHNVINALSAVSNTHPENSPEMIENIIKENKRKFSTPAIALHYLHKADNETLDKVRKIIKKNNILFTFHMAESQEVADECEKKKNIREVTALKKHGLLNKNTIVSHSIYVNQKEINELIKGKVGISHLPTSNVIHKSGTFPFWKFHDNGGFPRISLGTDGVVSKCRVDVFSEAYQTRITHLYHRSVKFGSLFKMTTVNGARVLGYKDRGRIMPGYKADLAIWKLNDLSCMPFDENNPITLISNLITHGGKPVRDLMINGKFIIKNRQHQSINESVLLRLMQKSHMKLREKTSD